MCCCGVVESVNAAKYAGKDPPNSQENGAVGRDKFQGRKFSAISSLLRVNACRQA